MRATLYFDHAAHMLRIEFVSTTHPLWPPVPRVVRMPFLRGHWHLSPIHDGKWTHAEYQVHADPGGSLPNWVVNMASKQIPHASISALRKQVLRRHYPEFEAKLLENPDYQGILQLPEKAVGQSAPQVTNPEAPK